MISHTHRALLLEQGIKPCYRDALPSAELVKARPAFFADRGLATLVHERDVSTLGAAQPVLYVARDRAVCAEAAAIEDAQAAARTGAERALLDRRLGRLLGYPPCCVDAFIDDPVHRLFAHGESGDETARMFASRLADEGRYDHRMNIVFPRYANVLEHIPCGFACAPSLRLAERAVAALFAADPELVRLYRACFRVVLEVDDLGQLISFYRPEFERRRIALRQGAEAPERIRRVRFV